MHADRDLAALGARKALLQARIAVHRMECVMTGSRITRPLAAFDRLWSQWKRLSPWVKLVGVPAALLALRKLTRAPDGGMSKGKLATLLGVLPMVYEAWKGFRENTRSGVMR